MTGSPRRIAARQAKIAALGPRPPWWRPLARRRWKREHAAIMAMDVSEVAEMLENLYPKEVVRQMANRPATILAMLDRQRGHQASCGAVDEMCSRIRAAARDARETGRPLPIARCHPRTFQAFAQLTDARIVCDMSQYQAIHVHTPDGIVLLESDSRCAVGCVEFMVDDRRPIPRFDVDGRPLWRRK